MWMRLRLRRPVSPSCSRKASTRARCRRTTSRPMTKGGRGIERAERQRNTAQADAKDYKTDQEVRWCPGCGDYAILAALQGFMPELEIPKERIVFVSGIGCAA